MRTAVPLDPCVVVIIGATGDLAQRKLIPALFDLFRHGQLPRGLAILGLSRAAVSQDAFRTKMHAAVKENATAFDEETWTRFAASLYYFEGDASDGAVYPVLARRLSEIGAAGGINRVTGSPNALLYLSVAPTMYEPIIKALGSSGLIPDARRLRAPDAGTLPWIRIVVEKPFGVDLASARSLNQELSRVFEEGAIYRIDHYLGKEVVQNIFVMRFANSIFEPLWNRTHVDHIQVTAAESIGVGARAAGFYDEAGAMRDMLQSHLLQVLALVAMEPPASFDSWTIMRAKIDFLSAARPTSEAEAHRTAAFGRYSRGSATADAAYVEEPGVNPDRRTETYAAMRLEFDNWRWAGVPFYLRTGKRMARKLTEVVVQFKRPPTNLFRGMLPEIDVLPPTRMVINIAPAEGLSLRVQGKVPGPTLRIDSAKMELDYVHAFGGHLTDAYGPLLLDAIRGDRTLYKHREEVECGWQICQPFIDSAPLRRTIEGYAPGSWGPSAADALIGRDGRRWHNPQ